MLPTYEDYLGIYGDLATIPESAYNVWLIRSTMEINKYLSVNIEEIEDEKLLFCVIDVIEYLYLLSEREGIASENTDGYSVSYDGKKADIYPIICRYLKEYLYRGIDI